MRAITQKAVQAFLNAQKFKLSNTEVKVFDNVTILLYQGNKIAYRYNDPERTLSITNCGWFSNTTKERLNALPNVKISQKKFVWYLNGKEWDGNLIDV
jgi:ribulose bisphosphate carboxylase small subunit